eukprot:354519-Chlamydomonas_euryale.AAC.2
MSVACAARISCVRGTCHLHARLVTSVPPALARYARPWCGGHTHAHMHTGCRHAPGCAVNAHTHTCTQAAGMRLLCGAHTHAHRLQACAWLCGADTLKHGAERAAQRMCGGTLSTLRRTHGIHTRAWSRER